MSKFIRYTWRAAKKQKPFRACVLNSVQLYAIVFESAVSIVVLLLH